jgi:hypothetical protein
MPAAERSASYPPPPVIALAAWFVPGLGHWLVGERTRGIMIGVTVVVLYVAGLLIGGVRVIEVPTYDANGQKITNTSTLNEVRSKPWSIAQVMAGPLGVASGAASVWAAGLDPATGEPRGVRSHARVNEIGTLYTAVAGMLNLLAILDAAGRAGREPR